jgi:hypothetical protein
MAQQRKRSKFSTPLELSNYRSLLHLFRLYDCCSPRILVLGHTNRAPHHTEATYQQKRHPHKTLTRHFSNGLERHRGLVRQNDLKHSADSMAGRAGQSGREGGTDFTPTLPHHHGSCPGTPFRLIHWRREWKSARSQGPIAASARTGPWSCRKPSPPVMARRRGRRFRVGIVSAKDRIHGRV